MYIEKEKVLDSAENDNRSQEVGKTEVKSSEKPKSGVLESRSQEFGKTESLESRKNRSLEFGKTEVQKSEKPTLIILIIIILILVILILVILTEVILILSIFQILPNSSQWI